jgi:5-carboxymethyl-2-hydroxymuconate isomerase
MPHLVFEATADLARAIDFNTLLRTIHDTFSARGYAKISTIRSRVFIADYALSGDDEREQFVICSMRTTVARAAEMEQGMAQCIHDAITEAIGRSEFNGPWQCGVFREYVPGERFVKSSGGAR